jgi:hypothetical protein
VARGGGGALEVKVHADEAVEMFLLDGGVGGRVEEVHEADKVLHLEGIALDDEACHGGEPVAGADVLDGADALVGDDVEERVGGGAFLDPGAVVGGALEGSESAGERGDAGAEEAQGFLGGGEVLVEADGGIDGGEAREDDVVGDG